MEFLATHIDRVKCRIECEFAIWRVEKLADFLGGSPAELGCHSSAVNNLSGSVNNLSARHCHSLVLVHRLPRRDVRIIQELQRFRDLHQVARSVSVSGHTCILTHTDSPKPDAHVWLDTVVYTHLCLHYRLILGSFSRRTHTWGICQRGR
jgi:hypothetical protein